MEIIYSANDSVNDSCCIYSHTNARFKSKI